MRILYFRRNLTGNNAASPPQSSIHSGISCNFCVNFVSIGSILCQLRTSFEADNYGALLVVDPEAELGTEEKSKLESDVREKGLSLVLFADWYSQDVMSQVCTSSSLQTSCLRQF